MAALVSMVPESDGASTAATLVTLTGDINDGGDVEDAGLALSPEMIAART
jgi:hypothetical protein